MSETERKDGDFKPPAHIFKKCVCGHACPNEDTYRQHTENCRVYAAEQIKNVQEKTENGKTTKKKRGKTEEQIGINPQKETKTETETKEIPNLLDNATEPLISDFNLDNLRLDSAPIPSVKLYTVVPVRKPNKQEFFQTREGWFFHTMTLQVQEGFNIINYMVDNSLWEQLTLELRNVEYYAAINTDGTVFLIPVTILERGNRWISSLLDVINLAKMNWVRAVPNVNLGAYDSVAALHDLGDAPWPLTVVNRNKETVEFTMEFLLQTAFFGRYISSVDHPVIQKLLGQTI